MLLSKLRRDASSPDFNQNGNNPRRPIIALILSLCPGLGQQYAGHLYRGIILYAVLILVCWMSAIAFMYIKSKHASLVILFVPVLFVLFVMIDAMCCAMTKRNSYCLKWYNKPWIYFAVFALLMATVNPFMDFLIGHHVIRAYLVTTESMEPTILLHDLVVINKIKKPSRNDIVLIGYDDGQIDGLMSNIIKDQTLRRIVAMPGDKVEVRGQFVFVNNTELFEPYVKANDDADINYYTNDNYRWGPGTVPENAYFVLSDSREFSFDSRMMGFVSKERINGVANKVFWSWNMDDGRIKWERTAMSLD